MKMGARNTLPAQIVRIKRGGVMCQVDLTLVGTSYKMSSVMTLDSLDEMGVKVGDTVEVVVKAINVLLAKS